MAKREKDRQIIDHITHYRNLTINHDMEVSKKGSTKITYGREFIYGLKFLIPDYYALCLKFLCVSSELTFVKYTMHA